MFEFCVCHYLFLLFFCFVLHVHMKNKQNAEILLFVIRSNFCSYINENKNVYSCSFDHRIDSSNRCKKACESKRLSRKR